MAGIQTSKITTAAEDDLILDPATGKKVKMTAVTANGAGDTPVSVKPDGTVEKLDASTLTELTDTEATDWLLVQAGTVRNDPTAGDTVVGQIYKIDGDNLGGGKPADPKPGEITASPNFEGGTGTIDDPFIISPATSPQPGASVESAQYITISDQKATVPVPFNDLSEDAGDRFRQQTGTTDTEGTYSFRLQYNDTPNTALGDGQTYKGLISCGRTTVYFAWDVTQIANKTSFGPTAAPTASPPSVDYSADDKYGTVTGTWADGSLTLNATNMYIKVGNSTLDATSKSVFDGSLVSIAFDPTVVSGASEGDTITGTLSSTDGTYYSEFSMVKSTTPAAFSISSLSDQAINTEATTGNEPIKGVNAPSTVSIAGSGSNTLTSVGVSVNGATAGSSATYNPGDTLQGYGTVGGANNTTYQATVTLGGFTADWQVSTTDVPPSITQPQITAPINGADDVVPDVVVTSSNYQGNNGAGAHANSTWELYEGEASHATSPKITASGEHGGGPLTFENSPSSDLTGEIVMVDSANPTFNSDGTPVSAEYTLQTSTISHVDDKDYSGGWTGFVARAQSSFDGVIDVYETEFYTSCSTYSKTFEWSGSIPFNDSLYVVAYCGDAVTSRAGNGGTAKIVCNGTEIVSNSTGGTGTPQSIPIFIDAKAAGVSSPLTSIQCTVGTGSRNVNIYGIVADGVTIADGKHLSFTGSNPDLQYFKAGDVVQKDANELTSVTTGAWDSGTWPSDSYGSSISCRTQNKVVSGIYNRPIECAGGVMKIECYCAVTRKVSVKFNNESDASYRQFDVNGAQDWSASVTGVPSEVTSIHFRYDSGTDSVKAAVISNFSFDGLEFPLLSSNNTAVRFMGIVDGNKASVTGGRWTGSDGSGFSGEDTSFNYGPVTGAAEIVSRSGSEVQIENVQGRFIGSGSANSAGQDFYATTFEATGKPPIPPATPGAGYNPVSVPNGQKTLTTMTLTDNEVDANKTYFSRVKYGDGSIESNFSEWSEFGTKASFVPEVGGEIGGGYFVGQINDNGTLYNIATCPLTEGQLEGQYGGTSADSLQYKTESTADSPDAVVRNLTYGGDISVGLADNKHPLFNWCINNSKGPNAGTFDLTNSTGTGISGFNDWYIPAYHELEILYRYLKPTADANETEFGSNPDAVPPTGNYTANNPPQTLDPLFREGGDQAYSSVQYWCATQQVDAGREAYAYRLYFNNGRLDGTSKTGERRARAIRRFLA